MTFGDVKSVGQSWLIAFDACNFHLNASVAFVESSDQLLVQLRAMVKGVRRRAITHHISMG